MRFDTDAPAKKVTVSGIDTPARNATLGLLLLAMVGTAVGQGTADTIMLPEPRNQSHVSVEEALRDRRSVRNYSSASLTLADIAQLLWSAQGVNGSRNRRTAPSAGALYPLELYLVAGNVDALPAGVYQYRPVRHALSRIAAGNKLGELARAALRQTWVRDAPAVIVMTAAYKRTTRKYGDRGKRYVNKWGQSKIKLHVYLSVIIEFLILL